MFSLCLCIRCFTNKIPLSNGPMKIHLQKTINTGRCRGKFPHTKNMDTESQRLHGISINTNRGSLVTATAPPKDDFALHRYAPLWIGIPIPALASLLAWCVYGRIYLPSIVLASTWAFLLLFVAWCRCMNGGWSVLFVVVSGLHGAWTWVAAVKSGHVDVNYGEIVVFLCLLVSSIMTFFIK